MKVVKVTKITLASPVPVYDLSIPVTENFCLANGCVVHNSKDCADAVAGVIQGLSTRRDLWYAHGVSPTSFSETVKNIQAKAEHKMKEDA